MLRYDCKHVSAPAPEASSAYVAVTGASDPTAAVTHVQSLLTLHYQSRILSASLS